MNTVNFHGTANTEQARGARRTEGTAERNDTSRAAAANAPQEKDAVEFSARGEQVSQLIARARESHEVRTEKVEPLQSQINTSSYRPSSDRIADAVIRDS